MALSITKTGGFPAEQGSTDCITRDVVDGFITSSFGEG